MPSSRLSLTSQNCALLQMVHALLVVALAHLLPDQARHHALDPLLANNGILCGLERFVVVVVYAVEGGRDGGLRRLEHGGLGCRHGGCEVAERGLQRCFVRVYKFVCGIGALWLSHWGVAVR